jgi:hypothetical protein
MVPAPLPRFGFSRFFAALLGVVLLLALRVEAFPPAPYYTLYGVVRDQVGVTLNADGADLILLKDGVEVARTPVLKEQRGDLNYELYISIDQNRASSRIYAAQALPAQGVYSLVVEMNGQKYYPIEVAGTLRTGNGGERVRLDLTLGVDANHDGLPDAWQEWVLYQAGRRPGQAGWDLNLVTKNGDFDGDGISNYDEYLAGTFAGDATERFELRIRSKTGTTVQFEFFAITGKTYAIEESTDLKTWTVIPFTTASGGATANSFRASAIEILPAFVTVPTVTSRFYRLSVR